jgi:rhodanese-related sulfurtransferase/DNA-directed RNA polymerase subunit RPC12/RpoP
MKLIIIFLRAFLLTCITFLSAQITFSQTNQHGTTKYVEEYVCMPCGQDCDKIIYNKPGTCPHCGMPLVKKSTVTFKTIQPADICNYIKLHPDVVLLDVRTKEEFERKANPDYGTLQNAINIPVQELKNRLTEIDSLKNRKIIVYCSHSHRSPQASYILTQNGFINVTNMAGGMSVMSDNACKK